MITLLASTALSMPTNVVERVAETQANRATLLAKGAPSIPSEIYTKVTDGPQTGMEDVPDSKARKAWAVMIVDVGIGPMFSAINDDLSKVEITKLSHNVLLDGELCGSRRVVFQYLPVPLITDRWWVIELRSNPELQAATKGRVREMAWTMLPDGSAKLGAPEKAVADGGMSVAATDGGWLLIELDPSHTLVEFWSYADPGGSVPVRLAQSFASGGMTDTIEGMAGLAKSGPKCTL